MEKLTTLYSAEEISAAVNKLARLLNKEYRDKNPLFICVLKGSIVFFSDLIRAVDFPLEIDFITLSSYKNKTSPDGCELVKGLSVSPKGRHVVLVEDIVDTGNTLLFLKNYFALLNVESLKVCSLLDKPCRRKVKVAADLKCFTVGDDFIVGYGLDYAQRYRNLPYVAVLSNL